ncbi:hypothetical protein JCM9279_001411 [Rhodotorula babjevae]
MGIPPEPFSFPVDIEELIRFTLDDPFVQSIATSSANTFFQPAPASSSTSTSASSRRLRVRQDHEWSCWDLLPADWRAYFEGLTGHDERDALLRRLSEGHCPDDAPPALAAYLDSCRSLSLPRTCSDLPVVTYPPSLARSPRPRRAPAPTKRTTRTDEERLAKINLKNAQQAGKSPKKDHECDQFSLLVADMLEDAPLSHCVDVGSGRAHLSRALACPPLDLHVLAIDWSDSQKSGAERLDTIRVNAQLAPGKGSLTHEVSALDADGVEAVLARWPPPPTSPSSPAGAPTQPALLVALHACGDLTPAALTAFVRAHAADPARHAGARAVFVGCCYNMQTPALFPLSAHVRDLAHAGGRPPSRMARAHLRLTPQSPPTWHLSAAASTAWRTSTRKLAFRARFEAELECAGIGTNAERRVGRVAECATWEEYRARALRKAEGGLTDEECPEVPFGEGGEDGEAEWATAVFYLRVFWTLRSWLGPPLETLCVLDRFAYLVEGLRDGAGGGEREGVTGAGAGAWTSERRVEVVNLFDQATGSLRNLALVVR